MEQRQGQKLACIEEIAYRNGFIDDEQMQKCIDSFKDGTPYKNYLINVFREEQQLRQSDSKQPKIKAIKTGIHDLYILEPKIFKDNRGYFFESFNENDFKILGLDYTFIQDNQSKSVYGTIRGLHLQKGNAAQAKLVRVLQGRILDVAVDLRPNSPTYGQHFSVELSADNQRQLLIPRGFAHGFSVLSDTAIVAYKCDNEYRKDCEASIRYDDPDLGIDWRIPTKDVIISEKDSKAVTFQQFKNENSFACNKTYRGQKILVTGANGQLAQELHAILGDSAYYVTHSELDISDEEAVRNFFKERSFDWVINCAAYTQVDDAENHPEECDAVNHLGALYLAKYGKNIVHISTDYVFDGKSRKPYKETAKTNPQTVYGKTKLAGEKAVLANAKTAVVIRTSWLYSKHGKNFVKTIGRLGEEHSKICVVTDQTGSPTYAADLARTIVDILPKIQPETHEIYHFSNEGQTSRYEFAKEILRLKGSTCTVEPTTSEKFSSRATRPSYSALNTEKIKKDFGIKNSNWKESLQSCLQH